MTIKAIFSMRISTHSLKRALLLTLLALSHTCYGQPDIELVGAIAAKSEDGSVAAWDGEQYKKLNKQGGHHVDPFADESPLLVIDINNYKSHLERLTPGLVALLTTYPNTFTIPVYPSHRTAAYPEWFYENMRNTKPAMLSHNGYSITNTVKGVNFPNPKNGLEAIWNHLTRWRGQFYVRNMAEATVFNSGLKKIIKSYQEVSFEQFRHVTPDSAPTPVLVNYTSYITDPPRLAGGALLIIDYLNQFEKPRKAWSYDSEQRRVKRLPQVVYDNAAVLSDGLRTADETDMYNGSPDRYDWKLLGREIKYIPYNSYKLSSPAVSYDELLTPNHIASKFTRFEAHRVWVLEATLKQGAYHMYKKRRFYLDEDTWAIAIADQYDHEDQIWRVSLAHTKLFYEVPVMFTAVAAFHDLKSRNYNVHGMTNEETHTGIYSDTPPDTSYFRPANLKIRARH